MNTIDKLRAIKRILFNSNSLSAGPYDCSVCDSRKVKMDPLPAYYFVQSHRYQHVHNPFFAETINFEHYTCVKCYASDRDRLYALYLRDYFKNANTEVNLLDVAPAASLRKFIKKFDNVKYRSTDLFMEDVDDKLDITNMHAYKDGQFDFFICSHVLEHIPDDKKAMQELYRVLKKGGKGIAMVPINLQIEKTLEDPDGTDIAKRWKYFGQDDHVRYYAKADFISRLQSVGFSVQLLGIDYFGEETFKQYAIFPTSTLYIVSK